MHDSLLASRKDLQCTLLLSSLSRIRSNSAKKTCSKDYLKNTRTHTHTYNGMIYSRSIYFKLQNIERIKVHRSAIFQSYSKIAVNIYKNKIYHASHHTQSLVPRCQFFFSLLLTSLYYHSLLSSCFVASWFIVRKT